MSYWAYEAFFNEIIFHFERYSYEICCFDSSLALKLLFAMIAVAQINLIISNHVWEFVLQQGPA